MYFLPDDDLTAVYQTIGPFAPVRGRSRLMRSMNPKLAELHPEREYSPSGSPLPSPNCHPVRAATEISPISLRLGNESKTTHGKGACTPLRTAKSMMRGACSAREA